MAAATPSSGCCVLALCHGDPGDAMCLVALFMEQRVRCGAQGTLICLWQPGMGCFSSRLTWLWGAPAFLLGCCGVPGAELKPTGCSLQPAPTARKRRTADMIDINVSLELFSLGQEKQVSASRANQGGVCLEVYDSQLLDLDKTFPCLLICPATATVPGRHCSSRSPSTANVRGGL